MSNLNIHKIGSGITEGILFSCMGNLLNLEHF